MGVLLTQPIEESANGRSISAPMSDSPFGSIPFIDPVRRAIVERQLTRKLDARCSPFVLIYVTNYLDRNSIPASRLKGLQDDLGLSDTQYATCLGILYLGYILMQVPSNIVINRIQRPSLYIACVVLIRGPISILSGSTYNFSGMFFVRFFLGIVEAALLPGVLLILSKWYTRRELTTRTAILFSGNLISNAFPALIAAGIFSNMQVAVFILPDLPHNSSGFTEEERQVALLRIIEDVGGADRDLKEEGIFHGFNLAIRDVKIYIMMVTFTAYVVGLSFNAFFPTLTATLGFGYVPTLLLSSAPWVFSCVVSIVNAWHADRTQEKFWHISGPIIVGMAGFIICMSTLNVAARYIALFLQTSSYAGFIVFFSWISSSFPRPPAKRAVAIAIINAFSQLGNIAGSYVWQLEADGFRKSYGIVLSMFGTTVIGCWVFRMILINSNKKLEARESALEMRQSNGTDTIKVEALDNAVEAPTMKGNFRYLI
ncbi:unnamed protein product [Clonostachys rhizophaga]|uniref:MFS general substrate transporter n=1 Tax=Clonostachys rhizophaga TaxID=160324 RepID=A0A9N9YKR7_9HYPO|nr:unnamed protein product [Clonostachys rhizophaga]